MVKLSKAQVGPKRVEPVPYQNLVTITGFETWTCGPTKHVGKCLPQDHSWSDYVYSSGYFVLECGTTHAIITESFIVPSMNHSSIFVCLKRSS